MLVFEIPTQVKFYDPDGKQTLYGIGIDDKVICACCGGIFELSEIEIIEFLTWVDFSHKIH